MIKVIKYTQGHLFPIASFTYRWRDGGGMEEWDQGEETGRMDRRKEDGRWMEGKDGGRKRKARSEDIDREGRDERKEGAMRNIRRGGREEGKRDGVRSLVQVPNRWERLLLQDPCWGHGAFIVFVRVTRRATWQCVCSAVFNVDLDLEDILLL